MTAVDVAALIAAQRELDPRVIDLARALSIATRIEVALVRHMRLELFPDSDAGLEANLWFGTLVADRDILGVALVQECRDELRRQLTLPEHRATLERAWQVIVNCHQPVDGAGLPPVINLQEAVTYNALAAAALGSSTHREAMQRAFGTLINALDDDTDGALGQWIARAMPTLPAAARRTAPAITLAEKVRGRDANVVLEGVPRAARDASGRLLADWAENTLDVGCRLRTDGIELSVPAVAGSHVLRVPNTTPLALDVQSPTPEGWHSRSIKFEATPATVVSIPTPASRLRITAANGRRLTLQAQVAENPPTLEVLAATRFERSNDYPALLTVLTPTCADLGWHLRWPAMNVHSGNDPTSAVLLVGSAEDFISQTIPEVPVLAYTADGVAPIGGSPPMLLTLEHGSNVLAAEFSPDAARIATSGDAGVRLWDAVTGELLRTQSFDAPSRAASFSADGASLVVASNDGQIRLWLLQATDLPIIGAHQDWVMSAEFNLTGTAVVTASQDHTAAIWQVAAPPMEPVILRHAGPVNYASFSPDESKVATASDDETAAIWRRDGQKLATLEHGADVRSVQWSPDGQWLLTADAAGDAWLWNASTFQRDPHPFHHDHEIHFAAFSPDGRRIATATDDGTAWIWHVPSQALMGPGVRELDAVRADRPNNPPAKRRSRGQRLRAVYTVAFSSDGLKLLTGGASGRAHVWDVATPARGVTFSAEDVRRRIAALLSVGPPAPSANRTPSLRAHLLALDEQRLLSWIAASGQSGAESAAAVAEPPAAQEAAIGETGQHALIAFIDDGIDVLHHAFLDADGRSRIVAVWDQRASSGPPPPEFEFGTLHTAEDIQRYVAAQKVPPDLARNESGQGTAVASVAAGRKTAAFAGGAAPAASIVAVIISSDLSRYSAGHTAALSFIDRFAASRKMPVVVNIGTGVHVGAHDGKSALELAFDAFSQGGRAPGRVIVAPAGSRRGRDDHARIQLGHGSIERLQWETPIADDQRIAMELWWTASNSYRFRLRAPSGSLTEWVDEKSPQQAGTLPGGGPFTIGLVIRHVDNGDSQLAIHIGSPQATVAPGRWALEIVAVKVASTDSWIDAWMQIGGTSQATFSSHVSEGGTLTVPATAQSVISVGAVASGSPVRVAAFSSFGPTRDGRNKPDVAAAGVDVSVARAGSADESTEMSGTSIAAASVAAAVALLLSQAAGTGGALPTATQIAVALRQTTVNYNGQWDRGQGYGIVDATELLKAFSTSA